MKELGLLLLTEGDCVVRGVVAETRSRHSQPGAPLQGAEQGGDAVDFQDVFDGGVHTGAIKQKKKKKSPNISQNKPCFLSFFF